jgi:HD superfamily phosphodiesterase
VSTPNYVTKAARDFLSGTPYRAPIQAIEAGARTIDEWCEVLNAYRDTLASPPAPRQRDDSRRERLLARLERCPATMEELIRVSGYSRQGAREVLVAEGALLLKRGHKDFVYVLDTARAA